jgi:hypothetical protein
VRIYATVDCSGAPLASGSAATFAGAGITVGVAANAVTNLRATATDAATNTSACSNPFAYTEDSDAPPTPSIGDTDPNSPANDISPQVKGSGAEAGSTVRIYTTADCSGAPLGSGSAAAFNGPTGITAGVPANQTTELHANATDAALNVSGCSPAFNYTQDSIDPATPSITDTDPDSPASDTQPEVKGSGAEAGSTVRLYADCAGTAIGVGTDAQFEDGGITVTVPAGAETDLTAIVTDAAGNASACSAPFPYDTTVGP